MSEQASEATSEPTGGAGGVPRRSTGPATSTGFFLGARRFEDRVELRVWAPERKKVQVVLHRRDGRGELATVTMDREPDGYFHAVFEGAGRVLYKYRLDGEGPFPDPASRAQPLGVHGPSEAIEHRFDWSDDRWRGIGRHELAIYELHVGTATREGTFEALVQRLPELRDLGVTAIELMPVAAFPGRRNWGYDAVSLFAPHAGYGGAWGLRRLVDAAHAAGLAVLLDVVYNHVGPDGNYLRAFSPRYFTDRHKTPWGEAIDFSHPGVRRFFVENAAAWIRDFHLDGLRLDATDAIHDRDEDHILRAVADAARAAAPDRTVVVIAEDDRNERRLLEPREQGGFGLDGVWADDFHHALRRLVAGDSDGYFGDYRGEAAEIGSTLVRGWLYEGAPSQYRGGKPRGTSSRGIELSRFVHCIQNHDQVGNRALGDRLGHSLSAPLYRAASALLLLSPGTPLLFMGQEWNATTPFQYFTDHAEPLGSAVREGRRAEFARFAAFSKNRVPDPQAGETFERSVLRWEERSRPPHSGILALYRELLHLRREHPALALRDREHVEASPLGDRSLVLRRKGRAGSELLLLVNLCGEPLACPLPGRWRMLLSTEELRFGGEQTIHASETEVHFDGAGGAVLVPATQG